MIIDLEKIQDLPFEWSETLHLEAEQLEHFELLELGEISWQGRVERLVPGFLLRARANYDQTLACVCCLEAWRRPVEAEVELMVIVGTAEPATGEYELSESDLALHFIEEDKLDTMPLVREQVELNLPMRALCKEDCAGICPRCGANRNETDCDCEESEPDPRWSALQQLKDPERG